jgi:hypothetical protein
MFAIAQRYGDDFARDHPMVAEADDFLVSH